MKTKPLLKTKTLYPLLAAGCTAVAAYFAGELPLPEALIAIFVAVSGIFYRQGLPK